MRTILFLASIASVIGLAFWAYSENYRTQAAVREVERLNHEIGVARERLNMLKAEWAYLNRPDRLHDLANINYDRLGLMPLTPEQFGRIDQVAYPVPALPPITDPIEVMDRSQENE